MTPLTASILARHDGGEHVAQIASAEDVSPGYVYGVLREHRPERKRKPRERTSELRRFILGLLAQEIAPRRVAFLAECAPAYVYKLIGEKRLIDLSRTFPLTCTVLWCIFSLTTGD